MTKRIIGSQRPKFNISNENKRVNHRLRQVQRDAPFLVDTSFDNFVRQVGEMEFDPRAVTYAVGGITTTLALGYVLSNANIFDSSNQVQSLEPSIHAPNQVEQSQTFFANNNMPDQIVGVTPIQATSNLTELCQSYGIDNHKLQRDMKKGRQFSIINGKKGDYLAVLNNRGTKILKTMPISVEPKNYSLKNTVAGVIETVLNVFTPKLQAKPYQVPDELPLATKDQVIDSVYLYKSENENGMTILRLLFNQDGEVQKMRISDGLTGPNDGKPDCVEFGNLAVGGQENIDKLYGPAFRKALKQHLKQSRKNLTDLITNKNNVVSNINIRVTPDRLITPFGEKPKYKLSNLRIAEKAAENRFSSLYLYPNDLDYKVLLVEDSGYIHGHTNLSISSIDQSAFKTDKTITKSDKLSRTFIDNIVKFAEKEYCLKELPQKIEQVAELIYRTDPNELEAQSVVFNSSFYSVKIKVDDDTSFENSDNHGSSIFQSDGIQQIISVHDSETGENINYHLDTMTEDYLYSQEMSNNFTDAAVRTVSKEIDNFKELLENHDFISYKNLDGFMDVKTENMRYTLWLDDNGKTSDFAIEDLNTNKRLVSIYLDGTKNLENFQLYSNLISDLYKTAQNIVDSNSD